MVLTLPLPRVNFDPSHYSYSQDQDPTLHDTTSHDFYVLKAKKKISADSFSPAIYFLPLFLFILSKMAATEQSANFPVISFAPFLDPNAAESDQRAVAQKLYDAFHTYGWVYLKDFGISDEEVADMFALVSFFPPPSARYISPLSATTRARPTSPNLLKPNSPTP